MTDRETNLRRNGEPWPFHHRDYPLRHRQHLPSTKEALNRAVHAVLRLIRSNPKAKDDPDLEIALREALANALIHGNGSRRSKKIFLRCYTGPESGVMILVRDEGGGFDPRLVPDPRHEDRKHLHHGRGLLLMRELMDYIEYRKNGREVLLFKNFSGGSPDLQVSRR